LVVLQIGKKEIRKAKDLSAPLRNAVYSTNVSEEYVAFFFRVEEQVKQETSVEQAASRAWRHAGFLLDVFYPENGGGMFLRNIG
jgi:hypothetical protein